MYTCIQACIAFSRFYVSVFTCMISGADVCAVEMLFVVRCVQRESRGMSIRMQQAKFFLFSLRFSARDGERLIVYIPYAAVGVGDVCIHTHMRTMQSAHSAIDKALSILNKHFISACVGNDDHDDPDYKNLFACAVDICVR